MHLRNIERKEKRKQENKKNRKSNRKGIGCAGGLACVWLYLTFHLRVDLLFIIPLLGLLPAVIVHEKSVVKIAYVVSIQQLGWCASSVV